MNNDLGKLQMELQSCQGNIKTLNSKLTYDMWAATLICFALIKKKKIH